MTITAADVSVLPASNGDSVIPQGIQPGNLAGLIKAIHNGDTYVNVHSETFCRVNSAARFAFSSHAVADRRQKHAEDSNQFSRLALVGAVRPLQPYSAYQI